MAVIIKVQVLFVKYMFGLIWKFQNQFSNL